MFTWIPNAYVKFPCTHEGLRAAEMSVQRSIRVNMTPCFSQAQAAAVYAATRGSKEPVYISLFVGRLDDQGEDGMDWYCHPHFDSPSIFGAILDDKNADCVRLANSSHIFPDVEDWQGGA
jgi:transaldolase